MYSLSGAYSYRGGGGGGVTASGGSIQSLLTQLQGVINPESDSYDPDMRTHVAIEYVSQISERLSLVQQEGELSGLRVGELCRTLVSLLRDEGENSPELMRQSINQTMNRTAMILSARAMCNLIEAMPGSGSILVDTEHCIDQLLEKLMNIQYIDVAEQAVLALQKISKERAGSLLKQGGLAALLTFIEFFPASVQRVCMQTAAALVVRVPHDCMDLVLQSIPLVLQKLESKSGLEEHIHTAIILYFVRVTQAVTSYGTIGGVHAPQPTASAATIAANSAKYMTKLEQSGLVRAVVDLLRHALKEPSLFAASAIPQLLSILVSLTRKSSAITEELLDGRHNIVPLIQELYAQMTGSTIESTPTAVSASSKQLPSLTPQLHQSTSVRASQTAQSSSNTAATLQQLNPLLSLAMELLPDLRTKQQLVPPPTSASPTVASTGGLIGASSIHPPSSAHSLFQQISRAMQNASAHATPTPPMPFSLLATPPASGSRGISGSSSTSDQNMSDLVHRQLTFLTPLLESGPSHASPEALAVDPDALEQMENEDAMSLAAEEREMLERDEDDESDESASPPPVSVASAAAAARRRGALAALAGVSSAAAASTSPATPSFGSAAAQQPALKSSLHASKAQFLLKNPAVLHEYIRTILPLFIQSASTTNDNHLRYKCVSGVLRILCVSETSAILDPALFPLSTLSAFVHSMLQTQDASIVGAALQLMDLLMEKCGDVYGSQFYREGCVETVQEIADGSLQPTQPSKSETPSPIPNPFLSLASGLGLAGVTAASNAAAVSVTASSFAIVQQRAKQLIQTHFGDLDGDDAAEEAKNDSMMQDEGETSMTMTMSPSKTPQLKRRRFSSCATPIFKKAQELSKELRQLMDQHLQLCHQLHEQHESKTEDVASIQTSLTQNEQSLITCLSSICSCIVGRQLLPPPEPTSPTLGDTLTTHEFLHSGLVDSLLAYLFNPSTAARMNPPINSSDHSWTPNWNSEQVWNELALQRRQRLFCHIFFGLPKSAVPKEKSPSDTTDTEEKKSTDAAVAAPTSGQSTDSIGDVLIFKLIESLESFDPIHPKSSGVNPVQALRMFTQPLRVRLIYKPEPPKSKEEKMDLDTMMMDTNSEPSSAVGLTRTKRAVSVDSASIPRRSTRSMTVSAATPASASPTSTSASSTPSKSRSGSPAAKKKGFLSSVFGALKRKVSGGSSSSSQAAAAAAAASMPVYSVPSIPTATNQQTMTTLSSLFPMRMVHIDPLANFQSIEGFLQESISLVGLYDKTERIRSGLPAEKSAIELEQEHSAATCTPTHSVSSTPASSRSGSKKKKVSSASKKEAASSSSVVEHKVDTEALDHIKLLHGIRQAHQEAQPIRAMFRFSKKSLAAQPTPHQLYAAGLRGLPTTKPVNENSIDELDDGEWHDISADRTLSLFEAIQKYHPMGIAKQGSTPAATTDATSSTGAASGSTEPRPFSAFEMFHTCYDIEFRLTRQPIPTDAAAAPQHKQGDTSRPVTPARSSSRAHSRSSTPNRKRKHSGSGQKDENKETADTKVADETTHPSQVACDELAQRLQQSLQFHHKSLPTLSALFLLLDTLHDLSHHWSTLYSSWPEMVEFFANNDSIGNGTTGRNVSLPLSLISSGAVSQQSHLPYSHAFSSTKLSRQLQIQCEDSIIVLGSGLPGWVDTLVRRFPFLFHLSSRELLFRVTAFHPARHLLAIHQHMMNSQPQLMQQVIGRGGGGGNGNGGGAGDGRVGGSAAMLDDGAASSDDEDGSGRPRGFGSLNGMGTVETQNRYRTFTQQPEQTEESALLPQDRVAQLKVRVHRENVLQAAKQLFIGHSSTRKGTIRAEFHNEEGVGIGPTLEFFTLVSQQLQLKSLFLWNKEPIVRTPTSRSLLLPSTTEVGTPMDVSDKGDTATSMTSSSSDAMAMELDDAPIALTSTTPATASSTASNMDETNTDSDPSTSTSTRKQAKRKRSVSRQLSGSATRPTTSSTAATPTSPLLQGESKRARSSPTKEILDAAASSAATSSAMTLRGSTSPPHLHGATPARLAEFYEMAVIICPECHVLEIPYCQQHQQFLTVREDGGSWHCAGELVSSTNTTASTPLASTPEKKTPPKKAASKKKKSKASSEEDDGSSAALATTSPASKAATSGASNGPRFPCIISTNTIQGACPYCTELAQSGGLLTTTLPTINHSKPFSPPRRELKHWRIHADEIDYLLEAYPKNALYWSHLILQCSTCSCINFPGYRPSSYGLSETDHGVLTMNKGGMMVTSTNAVVSEKAYRSVTRHVTYSCDGQTLHLVPIILTQRGVVDIVAKCKGNSPRMTKKMHVKAPIVSSSHRSSISMGDSEEKSTVDEEKEPISISRVQPSTPSTNDAPAAPVISRQDSAPVPLSRLVSAQQPTFAPSQNQTAAAFDEPVSQFVTSSSLYPPPTLQQITQDAATSPGVLVSSLEWSWMIGRFLGQALMEQRLLDLPFSQTFLKQIGNPWFAQTSKVQATFRRSGLDLLIPQVDHQQAPSSLLEQSASIPPPPPSVILPMMLSMLELAPHVAKPLLKALTISYHRYSPHLFPLPTQLMTIDGCSLAALDFDFTLPGSPEIELIPNGSSITVDESNVHIWLWLVGRQMLYEGVIIQMNCIQQGLKQVMDTTRLQPFYPHELEELISGGGSVGSKLIAWDWSVPKLRSAIKFRQGYHPDSPAILFLLTIMSELTPKQQRQFTRFITGSPSLPGGQIGALNPPLTVVKIDLKQEMKDETQSATGQTIHEPINLTDTLEPKSSAAAITAAINSNYVLPSVMTCSHYLKLPNYPTIEIMREKIMIAITEGSTGFTLS